MAIFIASLFWLLYRSGSQPRRLAYPCQQVAAVNVGAFIAALIPVSLFLRRHKHGQRLPKAVLVRRQVIAAAILCVVGVVGIETYQYADQLIQPAATPVTVPPPPVEPDPATVGIAHKPYPTWRKGELPPNPWPPFTLQEIDGLVERAIRLAGGLDDILVDKDGDGTLLVVLKPNLVGSIDIAAYPDNGAVTDVRVVAGVVRQVKEAAARLNLPVSIVIAEGAAGPFPFNDATLSGRRDITMVAYQKCGYDVNQDGLFDYDTSVTFADLNDCGTGSVFPTNSPPNPSSPPPLCSAVWIENAVMRRQLWVPNILLDCDVLINIPCLKNHSNGDVTLSLKNRVGCAPADIYHTIDQVISGHGNQMKHKLHFSQCPWYPSFGEPWNLDRSNTAYAYPVEETNENAIVNYMIVDQNLVRPQDFVVLDALIGVTNGPTSASGNGPLFHPDVRVNSVLASRDSVALDTIGTLFMGYDPQYVRHLRWGYNRQLGTMDTSRITQVGDRVALWRSWFGLSQTDGWVSPNGSPAETNPPTLYGISTVEGQNVVNNDIITVNGFTDDRGVTRAELAVAILGADLLTNGDFEDGSDGWTTWRAPWGTNEVWDFNNVDVSSMGGTKCLRLGGGQTNSSFGVYQQVAVTPGKTYRLDCQWKGKRLGSENWWEVILVDGPFDMDQADNGPIVEKNYMFAYDNAAYGFPGAIGTGFGWLWTHDQYAPPIRQVDWNSRLGRRKATGNTMTVILKAGSVSTGGVEAFFDNVTLCEVGEDYVLDAVANPTPDAQLIADMSLLPVGQYPGELRVTVYDAALNEDSLYRNVTLQPIPTQPWVCANKDALYREAFVGDPIPGDNVEIWNCGGSGGDLNYDVTANVPWIQIVPPDGTSVQDPPTTNVHAVSYDLLPPGTHTGTITITGSHNVKTIGVTIVIGTVKPDLDNDGDVDQTDFGLFQRCYTGAVQVSGNCAAADFNGDMFVNNAGDLQTFQNCLSGPGQYPDRDCD